MKQKRHSITHRLYVTPSGCKHPYYTANSPAHLISEANMLARVSVYPPLETETIVTSDYVTLHVLIESSSVTDEWEVQLWHNHQDENEWQACDFSRGNSQLARTTSKSCTQSWFVTKLAGRPKGQRTETSFTIRFRSRNSKSWKWVRDIHGFEDGKLIYQADLPEQCRLSDLFSGMSEGLVHKNVPSETPQTIVWSIEASASPAQGNSSGWSNHTLGTPTRLNRWFALVRLWSPWLAPRQGRGPNFAEKDALLYAFQRRDGLHVVVLALSSIDDIVTVLQDDKGKINLFVRNDRKEQGTAKAVVTLSSSFDNALAAAMYHARHTVSQPIQLPEEHKALLREITGNQKSKGVKVNWVENWYDGFTYCTWNGVGQDLTEDKILNALDSLKANNINITNLIIDDNWQSLDNPGKNQFERGWTDFDANQNGFPKGLKSTTTAIREKFPSINHIAVWHALLGYWGGISPTGKLAQKYKTRLVHKRDNVRGGSIHVIDAQDAKRMYNDFYEFLSSAGIDSVKTDVQFMLDEIDDAPARRDLTMTYLDAWNMAQLRHFAGHAISCMSQAPQIIFHSQLPNTTPAIPVRNSDDFFPEVELSHPWHIFCNAHNAVLGKHLNILPDWDMFQTDHPWAGFHAAARCVSGGPIYITDEPGKHDIDLIQQMTARTSNGQTVILRPSVVGRSLEVYVGYEEDRLCLVGAYNGTSNTGSSLMGVFNCRPSAVTEILHLRQYLGTEEGKWLVRSHRTGRLSHAMSLASSEEAVDYITVDGHSWDVLTARPVTKLQTAAGYLLTADFGLVGKMSGAAAIVTSSAEMKLGNVRVQLKTSLKALGTWGVWVKLDSSAKIDPKDMLVFLEGQVVPFHCVGVEENGLLTVDVDRAWKEMGLVAKYNNEVTIEALVKVS
ncbi:hypothetical protein FH972_021330 [Carpinus fangiana]|uniref:galactinol--sucrose galactosyltransferase n=1 Tax=Carpinus fangiana TaxID=176857 RepID=A0A5N6KPF2_9ROSI|nr:hypothetical protein FH972_021330 [Carpinus fangiana]